MYSHIFVKDNYLEKMGEMASFCIIMMSSRLNDSTGTIFQKTATFSSNLLSYAETMKKTKCEQQT